MRPSQVLLNESDVDDRQRLAALPASADPNVQAAEAGDANEVCELAERQLAEELAQRDRLGAAMAQISELLLRRNNPTEALPNALVCLGSALGLSRASYYEIVHSLSGDVSAQLLHEWDGGPTAGNRAAAALDLARLPRWLRELEAHRSVGGPIADLPPAEQAAFDPEGTQSVIAAPVNVGGVWRGVLCCEDRTNPGRFKGATLHGLRLVTSMVGAFLERTQLELALQSASERLERSLAEHAVQLRATAERLSVENTERLRAEQALRESRHRCLLAAAAANFSVWDWDIVGDRFYFDPAAGCGPSRAKPAHRDDAEQRQLESVIRACYDRNGHIPAGQIFERRIVHRDGSVRWFQFRARPIHDSQGNAVRIVGTYSDVTDRKRVEEAMRRAERLASVGTLAAGIAHEINNPIGAIVLAADFAQGCLEEPLDVDGARNAIRDIVADAERCGEIVRGILRFAKNEPTEKRLANLNDVVSSAIGLSRTYAATQKVELLFEPEPNLPQVRLNETEVRQAFVNLIRNAVESGADRVLVATRSPYNRQTVSVTIQDNGCGIGESELARLFDPFHTTRRDTGGTGLGLSLVHGITSSHGGTIDVATAVGHGTTFVIELPLPETGENA
jgi:signal transduction histidine kinase